MPTITDTADHSVTAPLPTPSVAASEPRGGGHHPPPAAANKQYDNNVPEQVLEQGLREQRELQSAAGADGHTTITCLSRSSENTERAAGRGGRRRPRSTAHGRQSAAGRRGRAQSSSSSS